VSRLSVTSGPVAGGTRVTVTGKYFTHVARVVFGSAAGTSLRVVSSTELQVTAPRYAAGVVNVEVAAKAGTSNAVTADRFTFVSPPSVSKLSVTSAPLAGGTRVTITGKNFTRVSRVLFGSAAGSSLRVVSSTELQVTAPKHAAAVVDVTVAGAYGTSARTLADHFSYIAPPAITGTYPASGPTTGGVGVDISGLNFTRITSVTFGGKPATNIGAIVQGTFSVTAPPGTAGEVDVRVTTPYGTSPVVSADHYTYGPAPTVTAVSPGSGPAAGGTTITITGTGFTGVTDVTLGGSPATSYTVDSGTQITAVTPSGTGTEDVQVDAEFGPSAITQADRFAFQAPPAEALTWTGPLRVDGSGPGYVSGAACLTATDCFAIDEGGNTLTWNGSTWSAPTAALPGGAGPGEGGITSCAPGGTFCATASFGGNGSWIYSNGSWKTSDLAFEYWDSLSCPSSKFCVAADGNGYVSQYNGSTWTTPVQLDSAGDLHVSCVSSSFCVLGAGDNKAYTWKGSGWGTPVSVGSYGLDVACLSTTWCIAVDGSTEVYTYNGTKWADTGTTDGDPANNAPSTIACTSSTWCMALDPVGEVMQYNGSSWTSDGTPIPFPENDGLSSTGELACAGQSCVEVLGGPITQLDSFAGGTWGSPQVTDTSGELDDVSCPTTSFCAAVGASQDAVMQQGGTWSAPDALPGAGDPATVACAQSGFCLAADVNGPMWQYDGANWTSAPAPNGGQAYGEQAGLACVSSTFCVFAAEGYGVSAYNGSAWSTPVDASGDWNEASCPSASFCAVADFSNGDVVTYNGTTWSAPVVVDSSGILALSCASATFCVATAYNSDVYTFNGTTWTPGTDPSGSQLESLSCLSSTFCAAVSWTGDVYTWDGTQWSSPASVLGRTGGATVSCGSTSYCVIVNGTGNVYTGT
jgi:hypothetical protein